MKLAQRKSPGRRQSSLLNKSRLLLDSEELPVPRSRALIPCSDHIWSYKSAAAPSISMEDFPLWQFSLTVLLSPRSGDSKSQETERSRSRSGRSRMPYLTGPDRPTFAVETRTEGGDEDRNIDAETRNLQRIIRNRCLLSANFYKIFLALVAFIHSSDRQQRRAEREWGKTGAKCSRPGIELTTTLGRLQP